MASEKDLNNIVKKSPPAPAGKTPAATVVETQIASEAIDGIPRLVKVTIIVGLIIVLFLLLVGLPPIREYAVSKLDTDDIFKIARNKLWISNWLDWSRLLLEILIGLYIGNQIFNDSLQKWFKKAADGIRTFAKSRVESSIRNNDPRVRIREAVLEISGIIYTREGFSGLFDDIRDISNALLNIYVLIRWPLLFLLIRMYFLAFLNAFTQKLHWFASLILFILIVFVKVLKVYLESPSFLIKGT